MTRRRRRKTTAQRKQETTQNLLRWILPRLHERKVQFGDYLVELMLVEKTKEKPLVKKGQNPDDLMNFIQSMPDEWFVKIYTMILGFIETTQPDQTVKGGKKNA